MSTRRPLTGRSSFGNSAPDATPRLSISRRRSSFVSKNSSVEQIAFADPDEHLAVYGENADTPRARTPAQANALHHKASFNLGTERTRLTPRPRAVQSVQSFADRIDKERDTRRRSSPRISDISMAEQDINIEVDDAVDVPGGMTGTVRFVGMVRGKKGIFAGIELDREYAARGKNDGDVEG